MLAWVLNWLFFDVDNRRVQHALTRNFYYSIFQIIQPLILAIGYNFAMNLIVIGLTLAGAALPQLVLASDSRNSNPDELTDEYAELSANPLPSYIRWFFACGLALGALGMGAFPPME